MLSKTYEALVAAGAPTDKAREAAEETGQIDRRLYRIEIVVNMTAGVSCVTMVGVIVALIKLFSA